MRVSQIDLNLLVVFDAIYAERNLTRASEILHITQPAVSNALGRLRKTFDDPLFVRTSAGMSPTPVAKNVIVPRCSRRGLRRGGGFLMSVDPEKKTEDLEQARLALAEAGAHINSTPKPIETGADLSAARPTSPEEPAPCRLLLPPF